jgi:hypothetical protein
MAAGYELPHAKSDPAYSAMVELYCEQLRPFDQWELTEGISSLIQSRKSRKWPMIGEIAEHCSGRLHPNRRGQQVLPKPERPEVSKEERALVNMKIKIRQEWESSGLYTARDERGNWRVTAFDCAREAKRRLSTTAA